LRQNLSSFSATFSKGITMRKPIPALLTVAALFASAQASKETLRFVSENETFVDTFIVWIDYARLPNIDPPQPGIEWSDGEKDSAWIDSGESGVTKHVRYYHSFYAALNGKTGFGYDHIYMEAAGWPDNPDPSYDAFLGFNWRDGSRQEGWITYGTHLNENREVMPDSRGGLNPGTWFAVDRTEGGQPVGNSGGIKFFSRVGGWVGEGATGTAPLAGNNPGARDGSLVNLAGRLTLPVPSGAAGLRIFDLKGRLVWEAAGLGRDRIIALPEDLPHGMLRCRWIGSPTPSSAHWW
jgi:hypothetical protein